MKNLLFTDLDGTILDGGLLSEKNRESLENLSGNGVDIILSTGKGLARVDSYLIDNISNMMILENGAKIYVGGNIEEKLIQKEKQNDLLILLDKIKEKIEFLFFYDSNNFDKAYFYVNNKVGISDKYREKFSKIIEDCNIFSLDHLGENLTTLNHKIGLLNIKVNGNSLEDLGLGNENFGFNLVFNEGMLNISLSNKGDGVENIMNRNKDKINKILVSGNDKNDLPMIDKVIEYSNILKSRVGVIIVGNKLHNESRKYRNNKDVDFMSIDTPDKIHIGFNEFFVFDN